jgi:2,4-dienoyl-CoA reductase-like NADH-dependent reductase (Old Yellow Enzyme family)
MIRRALGGIFKRSHFMGNMLEVDSLLEKARVDAIEMSGGNHVEGIFGEFFPARKGKPRGEEVPYYLNEARRYKETIHVPLMLVGGIRSYEWARRILSEGYADYIALSRPLIREPWLINRWKSGDMTRSVCVSDNGCFKPALDGKGVFCTMAARKGE